MKWIKYFFEALRNYQRVKNERDALKHTITEIEKFIETQTANNSKDNP